MINIAREEKDRAKHDTRFLLEVLERELETVRVALEILPLGKIKEFQGRAALLKDLINVLR